MFQAKSVEKIKTHFMSNTCTAKNRAVYEIMWKNIVDTDRRQMIIYYGACASHAG